jgi:hypothetical protein
MKLLTHGQPQTEVGSNAEDHGMYEVNAKTRMGLLSPVFSKQRVRLNASTNPDHSASAQFPIIYRGLTLVIVCAAALAAALMFTASAIATGDSNTISCPNEALIGFRASLPDCRAYEMVTPPFKDGVEVGIFAAASSGTRLLGDGLGTFAGTESNATVGGASYELSRTQAGWVTAAIAPPATVFPIASELAASSDLTRTLWSLRKSSESLFAQNLYLREEDGSLAEIGPMAPPSADVGPPAGSYQLNEGLYRYAGASSDLSHVLFTIHSEFGSVLWPGDTTEENPTLREGGSSLYEYAGTGGRRPELVGVSDGTTMVNGSVVPAGQLLSDCRTSLGSDASGDVYNAVSADGEAVFFTSRGHNVPECKAPQAPEVSELYARLAGFETVPISEPASSQCAACSVPSTVTLGRRPAEFQGASEDGSKVFFLTEQELLPEAKGMNLYEYDFDNAPGSKVVRVSTGSSTPEVLGVARVSEDGSHVYFVAKGVLTGEDREHRSPVEGQPNLYVFERDGAYTQGRLAYIATLSKEDKQDWALSDERPVQATPDGRFLVFESVADLTPGDTSTQPQVFEYDALHGELARISIGQRGFEAGLQHANSKGSEITGQGYQTNFLPTEADTRLAVSDDGSMVVFISAGALTPEAQTAAAAGANSVYEYRSKGAIANGNVYLISDGINVLSARLIGLSPSGEDVFFDTSDPLVESDVDTQFDIYDARDDGGFVAPAVTPPCGASACDIPQIDQPTFAAPASASVVGDASQGTPPTVTRASGILPQALSRLETALEACRRKHAKKRVACEARARRRYARKARRGRGTR